MNKPIGKEKIIIKDNRKSIIRELESIKENYPISVFGKKPTKKQFHELNEWLKTKGRTIDNLSASYYRRVIDLCIKCLKTKNIYES